jgi:hypothetical protein
LVNLITPDILVKFNKRNNDDDEPEKHPFFFFKKEKSKIDYFTWVLTLQDNITMQQPNLDQTLLSREYTIRDKRFSECINLMATNLYAKKTSTRFCKRVYEFEKDDMTTYNSLFINSPLSTNVPFTISWYLLA